MATDNLSTVRAPGRVPHVATVARPLRNPGTPLELDSVRALRVNRSAAERRVLSLAGRRTVKGRWQAAWLIRAVGLIDLTTLAGDDTPGRVRRLCRKAARPIRADIAERLGVGAEGNRTAAVCVYHEMIPWAREALLGRALPIAAVSTGFPAGLSPMRLRVAEIHASLEAGATEIDVVVTRAHVLLGQWEALYDEVAAFRHASGEATLKVILGTGELGVLANVAKASLVSMMAGADFVKTSTGKEATNATLSVGLVMARTIRHYRERTGFRVGLKPAGGIRTAKEALLWMTLMKEELGDDWLHPGLFRFGASSLLADIERQLEHHVTGRYSASHRHPMG